MCRFDQLPITAFAEICQNLTNLKDVFSLQSTNSTIRKHVQRAFWSYPRRLNLKDTNSVSVYTTNGNEFKIPACLEAIRATCNHATRLTEFDLSSDCQVDERFMVGVIEIIRVEVEKVTSLHLSYFNPDLMYAIKDHRHSMTNEENEKCASPSLSTHKKICRLVKSQNRNLKFLHIKMDGIGFLAIGRPHHHELQVEFGEFECTQNVMLMLHQVFMMYNSERPLIFRLGLNFSDPDKLKQAFIFCTHSAFPAGQSTKLREIYCRVPTDQFTINLDFNEIRADIRETLKKIVFHIDDWSSNSSKTLTYEFGSAQNNEKDLTPSFSSMIVLPQLKCVS